MTHRGVFETKSINSITLDGTVISATKAGTSDIIRVLIYDRDKKALLCQGTDVPADTTSGYAKGCLFIDTDVAAATTGLYVNIGTSTSADFDAVSDA